jgi:putative FmdB family regulatory protein
MPFYTYVCDNCEEANEALFPLSAWNEDQTITCPVCQHEAYRVIEVGQGIQLGGGASTGKIYPYQDKGLGCWVESAKDRDRICAERGLVPTDGADMDVEGILKTQYAESDRLQKVYEDYVEEVDHSPHFAEHRELRDKGHPAHIPQEIPCQDQKT